MDIRYLLSIAIAFESIMNTFIREKQTVRTGTTDIYIYIYIYMSV